MRNATLVTGLKLQTVKADKYARYQIQQGPDFRVATDDTVLTPCSVQEMIVPIMQFCQIGKPDVFIAYSAQVEELLGIPVRCMQKELVELRSALSTAVYKEQKTTEKLLKFLSMSRWERFKFLLK